MTTDLCVVWTPGRSRPLQFRTHLSVMRSRLLSEGQHIETRHEMLYSRQVFCPARGLLRAIVQLAQRPVG